jgi:hypothetical protein
VAIEWGLLAIAQNLRKKQPESATFSVFFPGKCSLVKTNKKVAGSLNYQV